MGEETPNKLKGAQEDMQRQIIDTLKNIFGDVEASKLRKIMNSNSRDGGILKTAIQTDRTINSVDIITEDLNVVVDEGGKKNKNIIVPKGTLKIVYGQNGDNVADLSVYVWRDENGKVQREIVAHNIDSKKAMGKTMENINYLPERGERKPYGDIPEIDGTGRHIRSRRMSDGDHPNK